MFWTHSFDLITKAFLIFISIVFLANIELLENHGLLVVFLSMTFSVIFYILLFRTIGSFIYSRVILKMKITFFEAKKLNEALSPNPFQKHGLTWLPLKEVLDYPVEKRFDIAIRLIEDWNNSKVVKNKPTSEFMPKWVEYLLIIVFMVILVTSYLDVPPSSYLIRFYCKILGTDEYSPLLITFVTFFVLIFILMLVLKSVQIVRRK